MMNIKVTFDEGLTLLKQIYDAEKVDNSVYELWNIYTLCSKTENWVNIVELKWDYKLTDIEAVKFWNIHQILNHKDYS